MKTWYVYIIEAKGRRLYTGVTTDVEKRFETHATGKGAKFFRIYPPKKIVYTEVFSSKSKALKKEIQIKKLSPIEKWELINDGQLLHPENQDVGKDCAT